MAASRRWRLAGRWGALVTQGRWVDVPARGTLAAASVSHAVVAEAGPNKPQLSESLPDALQRRKKLKAALEPLFAHIPHACAPPTESIYQGIDT